MLDRTATALIRPAVNTLAGLLVRTGMGANQMTLAGFAIGMLAAACVASGHTGLAIGAILLSRLCDALDGTMARITQVTDAGGFLDITLDFLFYASIPLAFAVAQPERNALAAAALLAAFAGTMSSFLGFAVIAAKRGLSNLDYPDKSIYFLGGLTEATETLAVFIAMCLWPQYFAQLAFTFAGLCAITTVMRLWWGWRSFR